ncbi:MAG: TerB family tellurite resistance protein [Polyangiaceae bacterium]|nr:TerB family tellurite resistance protein [Polyangiaceae bacterium]
MGLFPEVAITTAHAEAIARGLFAVAKSDGLHEEEKVLIASFWADVGGTLSALDELSQRSTISSAELASALEQPAIRELFLKTAILLAWADGKVSGAERTVLGDFAEALDMSGRVAEFELQVKEYLLSHLTHLSNTTAVAVVASRMSL